MAGRGQPVQQDELVSTVMETLVRVVWLAIKAAWAVAVLTVHHPLLTLMAGTVWLVDYLAGRTVTIWTAAVLLAVLIGWRLAWPTSFGRFVGLPAAQG